MFDEALEVIRGIWTTDDFSYEGRHFTASGITAHPRPVSRPHPPIWIGGNTAAARRRVTTHGDGWCPFPAVGVPGLGRSAEVVARTRSRVGTVAEAAVDSLTAGRDAALLQAEQIATRKGARSTETAVHRTRVLAGGLTVDELAVDNYDDLTVGEVASAVQQLTDKAALIALLRYEHNHKDRAGAVTAIENRLAALTEQDISRN